MSQTDTNVATQINPAEHHDLWTNRPLTYRDQQVPIDRPVVVTYWTDDTVVIRYLTKFSSTESLIIPRDDLNTGNFRTSEFR